MKNTKNIFSQNLPNFTLFKDQNTVSFGNLQNLSSYEQNQNHLIQQEQINQAQNLCQVESMMRIRNQIEKHHSLQFEQLNSNDQMFEFNSSINRHSSNIKDNDFIPKYQEDERISQQIHTMKKSLILGNTNFSEMQNQLGNLNQKYTKIIQNLEVDLQNQREKNNKLSSQMFNIKYLNSENFRPKNSSKLSSMIQPPSLVKNLTTQQTGSYFEEVSDKEFTNSNQESLIFYKNELKFQKNQYQTSLKNIKEENQKIVRELKNQIAQNNVEFQKKQQQYIRQLELIHNKTKSQTFVSNRQINPILVLQANKQNMVEESKYLSLDKKYKSLKIFVDTLNEQINSLKIANDKSIVERDMLYLQKFIELQNGYKHQMNQLFQKHRLDVKNLIELDNFNGKTEYLWKKFQDNIEKLKIQLVNKDKIHQQETNLLKAYYENEIINISNQYKLNINITGPPKLNYLSLNNKNQQKEKQQQSEKQIKSKLQLIKKLQQQLVLKDKQFQEETNHLQKRISKLISEQQVRLINQLTKKDQQILSIRCKYEQMSRQKETQYNQQKQNLLKQNQKLKEDLFHQLSLNDNLKKQLNQSKSKLCQLDNKKQFEIQKKIISNNKKNQKFTNFIDVDCIKTLQKTYNLNKSYFEHKQQESEFLKLDPVLIKQRKSYDKRFSKTDDREISIRSSMINSYIADEEQNFPKFVANMNNEKKEQKTPHYSYQTKQNVKFENLKLETEDKKTFPMKTKNQIKRVMFYYH